MAKPLRPSPASKPKLPRLFLVTDPARVPDPVAAAARLPRGAGVIYRSFGARNALRIARRLAQVCRRRGLMLLVGADTRLARAAGADGLHLPERMLGQGRRVRQARPWWLVTGAAHSRAAIRRAAEAGLDAALVSPVFASRSPSAGRPLGPVRFAALCRSAGLPLIGLGGVDARKATRILAAGAHGVAAVDGAMEDPEGLVRAVRRARQA